jgi:hypothetical protein
MAPAFCAFFLSGVTKNTPSHGELTIPLRVNHNVFRLPEILKPVILDVHT